MGKLNEREQRDYKLKQKLPGVILCVAELEKDRKLIESRNEIAAREGILKLNEKR